MGYGAYVTINNPTNQTFTTQISNLNCMFDGGDEGSNPSGNLGNQTIPANGSIGPVYVEAKGSGSCAFQSSTFNLTVNDGLGNRLAQIAFVEGSSNWNATSDYVNATANATQGTQATITVTITPA